MPNWWDDEPEAPRIDRVLAEPQPGNSLSTRIGQSAQRGVDSFWNLVKGAAHKKIPGLGMSASDIGDTDLLGFKQAHDVAEGAADWAGDKLTSSGMDSPMGARAREFGSAALHTAADLIPAKVRDVALMGAGAGIAKGVVKGAKMLPRVAEAVGDLPIPSRAEKGLTDALDSKLEFPDVEGPTLNGSGESSASVEAINRNRSMTGKGEQFVAYDRTGTKKPLIGVDAVDYDPMPGESYGIEGPGGFRLLEDRGGRAPMAEAPSAVASDDPFDLSADTTTHDLSASEGEPFGDALDGLQGQLEDRTASSTPKPRIPAKAVSAWQELRPKWDAALEKQAGDEIPFKVDPREDLVPFTQRVAGDDPAQLMGVERALRNRLSPDEVGGILGSEAGGVDPELLMTLGRTAGGAVVGGATGGELDDDNPRAGAIGGAVLGGLAGAGGLNRARYSNMLSALAVPKKLAWDLGNIARTGVEYPSKAKDLIKSLFSRNTAANALDGWQETPGHGKFSTGYTPLDAPSRALQSVTRGAQSVYTDAGFAPEYAARQTLVGEPRSAVGRKALDLLNHPGMSWLQPFAKVPINLTEMAAEHTPGLGFRSSVRDMAVDPFSGANTTATIGQSARKQAIGTAAIAGAGGLGHAVGAAGNRPDDQDSPIAAKLSKYLPLLTGGASVPAGAAFRAGQTFADSGSPLAASASLLHGAADEMPIPRALPWEEYGKVATSTDPKEAAKSAVGRTLEQFAPYGGAVHQYGPDVKDIEDELGDPVFGPIVARLPFLRRWAARGGSRTPSAAVPVPAAQEWWK